MNGLIWIASYPKSGNTWFRAFLANYLRESEKPVDINDLDAIPISSDRALFDQYCCVSSADLTFEEIDRFRPRVYELFTTQNPSPAFMKIHDANRRLDRGEPLISQSSRGAIYLIRNPLDVAVSFAHHGGYPIDQIIAMMANSHYAICSSSDRLHVQLRQITLSWSEHVKSWVDHSFPPVYILRYEDMKNEPERVFSEAIRFTGLPMEMEQLRKSIRFSSFSELRRQEEATNFKERSPQQSGFFFRQGQVGLWRSALSLEQVHRIVADHSEIMKRFGYLSENGDILV